MGEYDKSLSLKVIHLPWGESGNNPYQAQLARHLSQKGCVVEGYGYRSWFLTKVLREGKMDIVHLHWLHSFLTKSNFIKSLASSILFLTQLAILRLLGIKIIWTVHNLKNHDNKFLFIDRFATALVARLSHGIIAHSAAAKSEIVTALGVQTTKKIWVIPHGNYIDCYKNEVSQTEARKKLDLSESSTIFLFFGLIRPYKGVQELIEVWENLSLDDSSLLVVGKVWQDSQNLGELLEEKAESDSSLVFKPGFVKDEDIQLYMNACDLVVFPYREILTSGAVLLAMSFGRTCIAPKVGGMSETLDERGAFLYEPIDEDGLSSAIRRAVSSRPDLRNMGEYNYLKAKEKSWIMVSEETNRLYLHCINF